MPGRDEGKIVAMESYLKAAKLFRNYADPSEDPVFSEVRINFTVIRTITIIILIVLIYI